MVNCRGERCAPGNAGSAALGGDQRQEQLLERNDSTHKEHDLHLVHAYSMLVAASQPEPGCKVLIALPYISTWVTQVFPIMHITSVL